MPAYNASRWIGAAIDSALAQTWQDFELVISDNASTDGTLEVALSYSDPRIRVVPSERNVGFVPNHNRLIRLSRGRYIKFLHADDALAPTCVQEMVQLALEDERIGLVFAPREVIVYDENDREWTRMTSWSHEHFGSLDRLNEGRVLFRELLLAGVEENWVGEPSAVLLARACFERCGLFNCHLRQIMDLEMWMRTMLRYRIGFVERPLCIYRLHGASVTAADQTRNRGWLDQLWLFESLLAEEDLGPLRTNVFYLRRKALRRALRMQIRRLAKGHFTDELPRYLRFRSLPEEHRLAQLHERLWTINAPPQPIDDLH
jgi:glycosyltransferase involved in cell wall biosynthesis